MFKNLSYFNKLMFSLNIVLTVLTFAAYALPYIEPRSFPVLSVFTLPIPLFFILNGIFCLYWGLQFKKHLVLSALVLLLSVIFINRFYQFSAPPYNEDENDLTIMSYNIRLMDRSKWFDRDDVPATISRFINEKKPDILCLQEYTHDDAADFKVYHHKLIKVEGDDHKTAQVIFSKFPIINKGHIFFPNSFNYAVFADIKIGKDTIRVYNIHLESVKITADIAEINDKNIDAITENKFLSITRRIGKAFAQQQLQAKLITAHKKKCPYPIVTCTDMNNGAFSYVYRQIRGSSNDAFEEAGIGFGKTYNFRYFPARIDFIFTDSKMKVKKFENFSDFENSDHYPIMAKLSIE